MGEPSDNVPLQLLRHVHLVSSYTFPRLPQVNLDIAVEYLIQAPRITKEVAPMTWMYLDCPPDGEVMLVWQPSQLRTYAASDGYVWADAESAFSSEMRGYTVEMYVHRSGFRPANEMYATHCRRRFRLTPSRDPNPNVPPPDQSLWIIHYSQTEPQNRFPTDRIQVTEQVRQSMHERAMLQKHGQLVRKEFMLRDSANWPTLHLPGNANSSYPQQLMGYPGDVISHMNRSQQAYMQRQQTGAAHPGVGPSPAKRPRQGASGHAHGSTTSIPMPNVSQDAAYDDDEGTSGGDYMDFLTPRDISFHRYIQHHEWLEEIISSPFDTSQIIPGQIGLGRKGELESLTRDFFDAPTETTAKEAFPQPDGNSPLKESATPRVGRLEPGKAEDFAKRATERVAEINAEMEKLRRQHVRRMAKLNKGQSFKDAEQNLRAITLEMINGDPSKSDAVQKHKVDELTKGLEARIGKTIRPLQEIECIEKGGLEEKSQAGDIQDKDHEMVDNFGRLDSAAPPTIPYTEHGTSASANQLSLTNDTAGFAQNHALTRDVTSQGDVSMSEAYESSGAKDAGTDDWIMVNKDGNSAVSHQHTPDLDDFGNDPTMQTFTNALNADKNVEGDEVQGFGHRAGDDNAETFVADDFDEGIDFGDLDTAGVEMSGYVQEMESAGLEGKTRDCFNMNRSLSVRSKKDNASSSGGLATTPKHRFTLASLRGIQQPELSKKLFKIIKSENHAIGAYESASRERISIASQLSDWGEATGDDSISDISDKLGVLLSELGEQEDVFAQNLEDYRGILKQIRNTESSVQPSRDHKAKISDEISKLKYKEPQSTKIVQLEQELVRAEAQNLVAEAQLTNITRQKLKEAYDLHFAATIERAEKQIMLARHGRRLLNLLDDTPVVPGDTRPAFEHAHQARQVLNDAEEDLREWTPNLEPIPSAANEIGVDLMPAHAGTAATSISGPEEQSVVAAGGSTTGQLESPQQRDVSGSSTIAQPEATSGYQQ